MIFVDNPEVWGFEHAIRGMRNPLNSWSRSDSYEECADAFENCGDCRTGEFVVGEDDLALMKQLCNAGTEHRKFMRQIFVSMDIIAPLYWWKEFDTYKIGTVSNSCSTMHTLHKRDISMDDFSFENLGAAQEHIMKCLIEEMNVLRREYVDTGDKRYWRMMIQMLPNSYNQRRTITMNYENVLTMINQRKNHRLSEWRDFCKVLSGLPYVEDLIETRRQSA